MKYQKFSLRLPLDSINEMKGKKIKDRDSDFQVGEVKEGKVIGYYASPNGRINFVIVQFSDGWVTKIQKRSFENAGSSAYFYYPGDPITVKKKGFNETQKFTTWKIIDPRKFDPKENEYDYIFRDKKWQMIDKPSPSTFSPLRWVKTMFNPGENGGA